MLGHGVLELSFHQNYLESLLKLRVLWPENLHFWKFPGAADAMVPRPPPYLTAHPRAGSALSSGYVVLPACFGVYPLLYLECPLPEPP